MAGFALKILKSREKEYRGRKTPVQTSFFLKVLHFESTIHCRGRPANFVILSRDLLTHFARFLSQKVIEIRDFFPRSIGQFHIFFPCDRLESFALFSVPIGESGKILG